MMRLKLVGKPAGIRVRIAYKISSQEMTLFPMKTLGWNPQAAFPISSRFWGSSAGGL